MVEWIKVGHIISVISWMVAMLYLPRLMVYHAVAEPGSETSETFKIMERRLLKAIMTPAMIASWVFGLWLAYELAVWDTGWFISKFFLVIVLTAMHGFNAKWVKEFARDERKRKQKFYRFANEVPTLLMIAIVILVEVQPF